MIDNSDNVILRIFLFFLDYINDYEFLCKYIKQNTFFLRSCVMSIALNIWEHEIKSEQAHIAYAPTLLENAAMPCISDGQSD